MAVSNVYVRISRVPIGNAPLKEEVLESNIQATPADFWLSGGYYGIDCIGATFGTVTLQKRMQNGTTYVAVGTSTTFSANGSVVVLLGPGHYRLVLA